MSWTDHAEQILDVDAPREQWLACRRAGLGGSDARVLMGHGYADESEFTVLRSKLLELPEREDNIRFRRGNHMEVFVAEEFERKTDLAPTRTGVWRSKQHPCLLASPDWQLHLPGFSRRLSDYGLETKHVDNYGQAKAHRANEGLAPKFYWQCIHYLAVTGAPGWWCAIDSPFYSEVLIRYLDRELVQPDIDRLVEFETGWWESHVEHGFELVGGGKVEPAVEPRPDTVVEATLPELVLEARERLAELKYPATKAGKAEKEALEELLKTQIGDAQVLAVDGVPMFRWQSRKGRDALDKVGLEAEFPGALAKYTTPGARSWHLAEISARGSDEE